LIALNRRGLVAFLKAVASLPGRNWAAPFSVFVLAEYILKLATVGQPVSNLIT